MKIAALFVAMAFVGALASGLGGIASCNGAEAAAYDPAQDSIYEKHPITVTWIMIWIGSTEKHWWKPTDYHGCKVEVNGVWQSINWNDKEHIQTYCEEIRDAGIDVIVADLTNGFRWEWQAQFVQQFCRDNGMKLAIAFNTHSGAKMEEGCKRVWDAYVSPHAPCPEAYLYKDGKPVVVLYTTRGGYARSIAVEGSHRNKFSTVWASGEDSAVDKWGWQLEPHVGPVPSTEAMFVTSSIKYAKQDGKERIWRKHLSWLDYGFAQAMKSNPKYLIIGSFDDISERNGWLRIDTTGAPDDKQMRDRTGAVRHDAYYNRVREWLKGAPSTEEGGLLPDGAYIVKSAGGSVLGVAAQPRTNTPVVLKPYSEGIEDLIWFYHLGQNVYRLIKLNAGLPLAATDSEVFLGFDSEEATQRWILGKNDQGYRLRNQATGMALSHAGPNVTADTRDNNAASQYWSLIPQTTIPLLPSS